MPGTILYTLLVGVIGLALLLGATIRTDGEPLPWGAILYFALLGLIVKQVGFQVAPGGTHSLAGVVAVAAILVLGPVAAAWAAALTAGTHVLVLAITRQHWSWSSLTIIPLFELGLKAMMTLAAGAIYLAMQGTIPPHYDAFSFWLALLALCLTWFLMDHSSWLLMEMLQTGHTTIRRWLRIIFFPSLLVELAPLPLATLIAVAHDRLNPILFVIQNLALVSTSAIVRWLAKVTNQLQRQVDELTMLNTAGQAIISAQLDERQLCRLIFEEASQIVEADSFQLGLFDGDDYVINIWQVRGEQRPGQTFPGMGNQGIIGWIRRERRPLLVKDFERERKQLPAQPSYTGDHPPRSAIFLPLVAGEEVIGCLSVQSDRPGAFTQDHLRLLTNISNQAAVAIVNVRLFRQAAEKKQMERELELAQEIQRSLLPTCCPEIPGWEITADWCGARAVSGDFYDFFFLPQKNHFGFLIGDVSGKGVSAALFMALSRSLIRVGVLGGGPPGRGLARANHWILSDSSAGLFVTLFYGILDIESGVLTYVNAGHNPPLLYRTATGEVVTLSTPGGIALGIKEDIYLEEQQITLEPGDTLLLYTDGIVEATNEQGEFYEDERLKQVLIAHHAASPADLSQAISRSVADFVGAAPQSDDSTLVILQRKLSRS